MRGWALGLLVVAACGAEPDPPAGEPRLELGTGSWRFEALADGQDVELVRGAQGGWHLWISLRVTGAELDHPEVTLRMEPVDGSGPAQDTSVPLAFDPPDEKGARKLIGFTGIVNEPSCLVDTLLRVQASVSIASGEQLTDERDVMVRGGTYPPPPCEAP
jgi:hypothetical protein